MESAGGAAGRRTARALAAVVLAAGPLACGGGHEPSSPTPVARVAVSGRILDTFGGQPIAGPAWIKFGQEQLDASDGNYSGTVPAGSHIVTIEGSDVAYRRIVGKVSVTGGTLDFEVLARSGFSLDVGHYQYVAMGIASYSTINVKSSRRWTTPVTKLLVVGGADLDDAQRQAVQDAVTVIPELTGGVLAAPPVEQADEAPAVADGLIVLHADGCGQPRTSVRYRVRAIASAEIHACLSSRPEDLRDLKHEIAHALSFDHSADPDSLLNPDPTSRPPGPSAIDVAAGFLKYRRQPGHVLDLGQDFD